MKKLLFVFVFLLTGFSTKLYTQTNVSGVISSNAAWTLSSSPYIVTGNILVNTGVTLTIEPGVIVKFEDLKSLQVNGQLIAMGNSNSNITFTSNNAVPDSGDWGYIFFSDVSNDAVFDASGNYIGGCILQYCTIEYAGSGANTDGAVQISSSHPFINYCTIRNNSKAGIYASGLTDTLRIKNSTIYNNSRYCLDGDGGGGIYTSGGTVIISKNTIRNNSSTYHADGGGVYINTGKPIITRNTISNNVAAYNGGAVYLMNVSDALVSNNIITGNTALMEFGGIYTLYGTATISDNILYNNGGGMNIYYGSANITNNFICNNSAPYAGGGLLIRGAAATISKNIISDNTVVYTPYNEESGGGICLNEYWTGMSVTITKNSIIRNKAKNASAVDYFISYTGSYNEDFKYNTITGNKATNPDSTCTIRMMYLPPINHNNFFDNTATYELYNGNANTTTLDAVNNWWGTTDNAQIQLKIYDWFEDASLGIVNYTPYLTELDTIAPVSPPANVIKTNLGGGQVKLTWNNNHESDISGYHIYYGDFNGYSFTNVVDAGNVTNYTLSGVSFTGTIGVTAYDRTYNPLNENDSTIVNENMTNGNESWYSFAVDTSALNGIVQTGNTGPKDYKLFQNYPNPFNPTTKIEFRIPNFGFVSIKIFDILGREVTTLVNEVKKPGTYEVKFDASNLSSGIYFYRMQAGDFAQTHKMIFLK